MASSEGTAYVAAVVFGCAGAKVGSFGAGSVGGCISGATTQGAGRKRIVVSGTIYVGAGTLGSNCVTIGSNGNGPS
jgi:hypothetical protein